MAQIEIQLSSHAFDELDRKLAESGQFKANVSKFNTIDFPEANLQLKRMSPGRNSVLAIFPIPLESADIEAALADQGNLMKLRQRLIDKGFSVPPGLLRSMLLEAR